jgi:hypothetical protein
MQLLQTMLIALKAAVPFVLNTVVGFVRIVVFELQDDGENDFSDAAES